jgi:hypothetical protein
MSDTKATADKTSEGDGKNSEGKAEGAGTQTATTEDAPKFTQADIDRIAAKTRQEERDKAKREADEAEAKRKEEEAKKQGEFESLYNDLKPAHEAQSERLKKYEETVKAIAEADLSTLPAEVKDMAPDLSDPLAVLAWLPKGKALAEKLEGKPAKPGNGGDPKPKGVPGDTANDKRAASRAAAPYKSL